MQDPFDGFGRNFAKVGALALVLNVVFWGALTAIVLVALNVAGVI